jgi:hypothetical protein
MRNDHRHASSAETKTIYSMYKFECACVQWPTCIKLIRASWIHDRVNEVRSESQELGVVVDELEDEVRGCVWGADAETGAGTAVDGWNGVMKMPGGAPGCGAPNMAGTLENICDMSGCGCAGVG